MEEKKTKCKNWEKIHRHGKHEGGAIYFFGLVGSAIYFIQQASTFGEGVVGFLKALVWPAFLVYRLLGFLGI